MWFSAWIADKEVWPSHFGVLFQWWPSPLRPSPLPPPPPQPRKKRIFPYSVKLLLQINSRATLPLESRNKRFTNVLEIRVSQKLAKLREEAHRMSGRERIGVNCVAWRAGFNTGSNIGRWDVVNLLLVGVNLFEPSALSLKTIFWDLNGVGVVKEG